MMPDVAAHVLRLDHAPVAAALSKAGNIITTSATTSGSSGTETASRARVILGLDRCPLCENTRICPDCGQPCEVCTPR